MTADAQGRGFAYDAANVLRSASGLSGGTAEYRYYADGNRSQKTYNGASSQFYYDADQEIYETDGSGTKLRRYVRLPGSVDEPFLMIDYTLDAGCTNTSYANCEVWAHQNRLGSVVAVTDAAGTVVEKYRYSPYGVPGSEGASGFPFRFTGQKLDPETGLYYYKARYYDPETGRFLQTDPIGYRDQMNLYAYVANGPINSKDPTGLCANSTECHDPEERSGSYKGDRTNSDGSVTTERQNEQHNPDGTVSVERAGSIKQLPQETAGGDPAPISDAMEDNLLDLSDSIDDQTVEVTSGY